MDAEKLLVALEKAQWRADKFGGTANERAVATAKAAVLAAMQPAWIRCADRLPERGQDVLVWVKHRSAWMAVVAERAAEGDEWWTHMDYFLPEQVTHWQPLPPPPED